MTSSVQVGDDGIARCDWPGTAPDHIAYHDHEWGRPVTDDIRLFEKICLEGFQSGLSWLTILRKREAFRSAFAGFDFAEIAAFDGADVDRLLEDAGIVRHRGKVRSTINNAARALEMVDEYGSLASYFWLHEPAVRADRAADPESVPAYTETSTAVARDLKRRGWTFVGPTTIYAFMQAMGLVNDHVAGCEAGRVCDAERAVLTVPR